MAILPSRMSKSSSSTSNTTIPTSPEETLVIGGLEDISPMERLEGIETHPYVGIANMRRIVKLRYDELQRGDSAQQYLTFMRVSVDDLAKIDGARNRIGKYIRLTHYTDEDLLIVKLPTAKHERAYFNFAKKVIFKLARMGMPEDEFDFVGATTYYGHNSSKQGDSAYKPLSRRPNDTDWPTLVFEIGFSESLRELRFDAEWWLKESGGRVKIAIIISIKGAPSTIHIEKWELRPMAGRRLTLNYLNNNNSLPQVPTKVHEITIVPNVVTGAPFIVTGAPLILEFAKIFLRPAVPPEIDITFTGQELSTWAAILN